MGSENQAQVPLQALSHFLNPILSYFLIKVFYLTVRVEWAGSNEGKGDGSVNRSVACSGFKCSACT